MKPAALTLLLLCSAVSAFASPPPSAKPVMVNVNDVYVPGGFSSDSDAYVVMSGIFPNSCYRYDRAEVKSTGGNLHEIGTYARVSQGMCLMVMVPWTRDVSLGRMDRGSHTLRFLNGDGTFFERTVEVE